MFTKEALNILGVSENKRNEIENGFDRLLKRYPPEFFPEISGKMRYAYHLLTQDQDYWFDVIKDKKNCYDSSSELLENLKEEVRRKRQEKIS